MSSALRWKTAVLIMLELLFFHARLTGCQVAKLIIQMWKDVQAGNTEQLQQFVEKNGNTRRKLDPTKVVTVIALCLEQSQSHGNHRKPGLSRQMQLMLT